MIAGMRIWTDHAFEMDDSAITRVFGILAQRGGGKTYAATRLAEEFLTKKAQIIVIDPVGVWWGLRIKADGKGPAFDIPVIGGLHGDLDDPSDKAGEMIARALIESSSSAILDVSMLTKGAQRRFLTDFAETFFHLQKGKRTPVHLFLEEAQEIVPQRVMKGSERLLGAFESIVKLGRNFGIGATLISQRPQSVHKDVLNQADVLVCLRTSGPQERKAIEAWVREHEISGEGDGSDNLLSQIAKLQPGDAIVWSPAWLDAYFRTRILPKATFDASKAPELGDTTKVGAKAVMPKLDLEHLRKALANAFKETNKETITATSSRRTSPSNGAHEMAIIDDKTIRALRDENEKLRRINADFARRTEIATQTLGALGNAVSQVIIILKTGSVPMPDEAPDLLAEALRQDRRTVRVKREIPLHQNETHPPAITGRWPTTLKAGAVRMLETMREWHGVRSLTKTQLATLTDFTESGGTFQTYLGKLKTNGLVISDGADGYRMKLTAKGFELAENRRPVSPNAESIAAAYGEHLKKGARDMLQTLIRSYPHPWTKDRLAAELSMTASGGTFQTYLGKLISNELVERTKGGVRASAWIMGWVPN